MSRQQRIIDKMADRTWVAYQLSLREIERERKPAMKERRHESYLQFMARTTPQTFDQEAAAFEKTFGQGALKEESQAGISATLRKIREMT